MGTFGAGRFLQSFISCKRPWIDLKANETEIDTPTSGSFGNDTASQTSFDREELEYRDERDLDDPTDR